MEFRRRAIAVGITFFLAAATGHLMQNADAIAALLRGEAKPASQVLTRVEPTVGSLVPVAASTVVGLPGAETKAPITSSDDLSKALPAFPVAEPVAFSGETFLAKRIQLLGDDAKTSNIMPGPDSGPKVFGFGCGDSTLSIEAQASAMLHVVLSAPCHKNERVVFHHSGLVFAMATDGQGAVDVMLPALSEDGAVTAVLAGGAPLTGRDTVADLGEVSRIAVQAGRVPGLRIQAAPGLGSVLASLGDPSLADPLLAEVYSAPKGKRLEAPQLEATVMAGNCGRTISAKSLRTSNGAAPASMVIKLAMPGCDGLNDMVVMPLHPVITDRIATSN
jgi:hypothetical protein